MRRDITVPAADYQVTPFIKELSFDASKYSLKRILAVFAGNTATVDFGIYCAPSGLSAAGLTALVRSTSEVYADSAVAATADPIPEINATGQPTQCDVRGTESLYVRILTGDASVSGTVRLFL